MRAQKAYIKNKRCNQKNIVNNNAEKTTLHRKVIVQVKHCANKGQKIIQSQKFQCGFRISHKQGIDRAKKHGKVRLTNNRKPWRKFIILAILKMSKMGSSKNTLFFVVAIAFLASPSLTQTFKKEAKEDVRTQLTTESANTKETVITLNDYPSFEMSAGSERATLRNPFSAKSQDSKNLSNLTSPKIVVRGFGSDQYQDTVFISLNNGLDNEFTLGQQVGNGFRLSYISPTTGEIEISNGSQRIRHKAQKF